MPEAKLRIEPGRGASQASALEEAFELVASLPVPVFFKSRDGRYLGVNRAWEEFFGLSAAEFVGRKVADLYPQDPAIAERHARMDDELYARGGRQSYEIELRTRKGELRTALYYKSTIDGPEGVPTGLIGTIVDITDRKRAEAALRASEASYRATFELAGSGVAHIGLDRRFIRVNRRLCEILGYSEAELLTLTGRQISHPDDLNIIDSQRPALYAGKIDRVHVEKRYVRKDGTPVWVAFSMVVERDAEGRPLYEIGIYDDITGRKLAEDALRDNEERWRAVIDSANDGILIYDKALNISFGNRAAEAILGLPLAALLGKPGFTSLLPCVHADGTPIAPDERPTRMTLRAGRPLTAHVVGIRRPDGSLTWLSVKTAFLRRGGESDWYGVVSTIADVTLQRNAEQALRESEARFRQTFELAGSGMAHVDLDGRLLRVNRRLREILGRSEQELVGLSVKDISHPEDRDVTDRQRARVRSGELEVAHFEKRYVRADGQTVWVDLAVALARSADGTPLYEIAVFDDITERKQADAALRAAHEELKRSNSELEQFAYVASHDLQEPLRMVSSYTQLIQRRYGDKLDGDAKEFMHYVVDGAARMKQLIEDLLAYSRVGTKGKQFREIELEAALKRAVTNLRAAIEESGAAVTWDPLPRLSADDVQLAQLFQNLIGNALKFRGAGVPRIHVSAVERESDWEFAVRDNGIGIEPQYFERIFMVFQRLHTKGEYPGTGIGLAICKKVVERHRGEIWVTSQPGEGSQFHFTLPKTRDKEDA
jgi:PAS domain S-box-containing protein